MKVRFSFFILLFLAPAAWTDLAHAANFEEATDKLLRGDIDGAVTEYELLLARGMQGSAIYANLGYAFQKQNKLPEAALSYYRALMLNPQCTEAKEGLNQLRIHAGLPVFAATWMQGIAERIPSIFLLITGEISFWIGAFLGAGGVYHKKFLPVGSCLLLIGIVVFGVGWFSDPRVMRNKMAIVTAKNGEPGLTQPVATAAHIASLLPGTPLIVIAKRGDWSYCQLSNSRERACWIPSSSLSFIYPQSPSSHHR